MSAPSLIDDKLPTSRVWVVDPVHSTVEFFVKHHAVGTFRGRFLEFEAEFDGADQTLNGWVNVESLSTFDMLKEHLVSDEFLAGKLHPRITFSSTSIAEQGANLTVEGDLTMKGVTNQVTATGTCAGPSKVAGWDGPDNDHIGMDLEIEIDRRDFGVDFNSEQLDGQNNLGWAVTMRFALEFAAPVEDS